MSDAAVGAIAFVTLLTIMVGARGIRVARTPDDFMVAARQVPPALNAAAAPAAPAPAAAAPAAATKTPAAPKPAK